MIFVQEGFNQFKRSDVWDLVPHPQSKIVIDIIWFFHNKIDEHGIITRNKAILVAKGYNQAEGIDYEYTYAIVAHIKAIQLLLAFTCYLDFKLYHMDVKSAFLNKFINKEVYFSQPLGLEDHDNYDHVFKMK